MILRKEQLAPLVTLEHKSYPQYAFVQVDEDGLVCTNGYSLIFVSADVDKKLVGMTIDIDRAKTWLKLLRSRDATAELTPSKDGDVDVKIGVYGQRVSDHVKREEDRKPVAWRSALPDGEAKASVRISVNELLAVLKAAAAAGVEYVDLSIYGATKPVRLEGGDVLMLVQPMKRVNL